jgi:hypothetical protein
MGDRSDICADDIVNVDTGDFDLFVVACFKKGVTGFGGYSNYGFALGCE